MRHLVIAALLLGVLTPQIGAAQVVAEPGSELEVYVMTMGQGDYVWERFGHNALGIRDRARGTDVIYNWGTFSFDDPGFVPRFLTGRMRYWVQAEDAARALEVYRYLNRSIWIQELRLTPAQRLAAKAFVEWNVREENKFYRYDYFGDNCSTRVRDALDRILEGGFKTQFESRPSGRTFRDETRRLTLGGFWTYVGIDVALGTPSDREMTRWEAMYVPGAVRAAVREVRVETSTGLEPLVASEQQVFAARRGAEADAPRVPFALLLSLGALVAVAIWLLALRGGAPGIGVARLLAATWSLVSGLLGVVLVLMWTATDHVWTHANVNLLLFSPLWLAAAWILVRRRWRGSVGARRLAWGLGCLLGLGLVAAGLRNPQHMEVAVALALPLHAAAVWLLARREKAAA